MFDCKTGKKTGDRIDILSTEGKKLGKIAWEQSEDKSKVLIGHESYNKKKNKTTVTYRLFDENIALLAEEEMILEGERNEMSIAGVVIDNDGSVYSISYFDKGFDIIVLDADKDFEKWNERIIIEGLEVGENLRGGNIKLDANGDIVNVGYFADEKGNLVGYSYMKIDAFTKEVIQQNVDKFPDAIMDTYRSKGKAKRGKTGEIKDLFVSKLISLDDGSILFLSEEQSVSRSYSNNSLIAENYYFKGIMVSKFNANGEFEWVNKIEKKQLYYWTSWYFFMSSSGGVKFLMSPNYLLKHYSYTSFTDNDNLYVAYHENPKNLKLEDHYKRKWMKNPYKSIPYLATINLKTGDMTSREIKRKGNDKLILVPGSSKQSNQNADLFLMMAKKKYYKFGKLEL